MAQAPFQKAGGVGQIKVQIISFIIRLSRVVRFMLQLFHPRRKTPLLMG